MGNQLTGIQSYNTGQYGYNSPLNSSFEINPYATGGQIGVNPGANYNVMNTGGGSAGLNLGVSQQFQNNLANPTTQQPTQGGGSSPNAMGVIGAGMGALSTGMNISNDYSQVSDFDVNKALPQQVYNPRSSVPVYQEQATPEEIAEGTGSRAQLSYAGQMAGTGAQLGGTIGMAAGPAGAAIGTAIGAGAGILGGLFLGGKKGKEAAKKRSEFKRKQEAQKVEHGKALNRYYNIQNKQRVTGAQQMMTAQRGQNLTPYYTGNIYGIG